MLTPFCQSNKFLCNTVCCGLTISYFIYISVLVLFVDDNIGEVEYPASPISHAHLHKLRFETAKMRLNGTMQQVDILSFFCSRIVAMFAS